MADHVRQQIRAALKTQLTGLTTTGANVFANRVHPVQPSQLPCLLIETNNEVDTTIDVTSALLDRKLDVVVRVVAKANANLDDTLDTAMKEVEAKLYSSLAVNTLNDLVKSMQLQSIDVALNGEQEKTIGQATMLWQVNYFTRGNAPDVSI